MPKIQQYTSEQAFRGVQPSDRGIRANEEMAHTFAETGRAIGSDITEVTARMQDKQDSLDLIEGQAKNDQDTYAAHQQVMDALQSYDSSKDQDHQFVPTLMQSIKDKSDGTYQDAISGYSPKVQAELTARRNREYGDLALKALGETYQARSDQVMAAHDAGLESQKRLAGDDPSLLGTAIAKRQSDNEAWLGLGLTRAQVNEKNAKDADDLAYSTGLSQLERMAQNHNLRPQDVETFRGFVNDQAGDFYNNLTQDHRRELNVKLDQFKDTTQGIGFGLVKQQLPDAFRQIDEGGSADAARARVTFMQANARTKEEVLAAADAAHDLEYHEQYGAVNAKVRDMPDSQIQGELDKTHEAWKQATTPDDRNRLAATEKAITAAREQRDKEFHVDPAAYGQAHDSQVQSRASDFAKAPSPQTFAAYAAAQESYQRKLFPGDVPKLVTNDMRDHLSAAMQGIRDPGGVAQAGGALQNMAKMTGGKWTQVARELHTSNILNDDQFVAATLYGKPAGAVIAGTLLQASAMSGKDLYALHGVSSDKAAQAAIAELQPLAQSLGNAGPDGADIMRANTMALAHLMQVRGDTGQAHDLAQTLVMDEFTFTGRHGSTTLRVPNRPDLDAGKIQSGSDTTLNNLGDNVHVPFSASGLNPGDQRKVYLDRIKHTGVWYTNKDGSGAILYDIDSGSPVQEWQGKSAVPVARSWRQLMDQGATQTSSGAADIETLQSGHKHF